MKKSISIVVSSLLVGSAFLVGCGSDSSTSTSSSAFGGAVVKGTAINSKVWADLNGDGLETSDEVTTTDANGDYSFSANPTATDCKVTVYVENDKSDNNATAKPLRGYYKASKSRQDITTITEVLATLVESGSTLASAETLLATFMGVSSIDDATKNPKDLNATMKSSIAGLSTMLVSIEKGATAGSTFSDIVVSLANKIKSTPTLRVSNVKPTDMTIATSYTDAKFTALKTSLSTIDFSNTSLTFDEIEESANAAVVALDKNITNIPNLVKFAASLKNFKSTLDANQTYSLSAFGNTIANIDTNAADFNITATTDILKTTAVLDKADFDAARKIAIAQALINSAKAVDSLKLTGNKVTIGDTETTVAVGGVFSSITHANVASGDLNSLYGVSFTLENVTDSAGNAYSSLEDGDDKNVTIALKIEDGGSSKKLLAIINNVSLTRVDTDSNTSNYNGNYNIAINSNTKLDAYAIKSNGSLIYTNNVALTADAITSANGIVSANIGKIVTQLESDTNFASSIATIKNQLTLDSSYTVSTYMSGVDGVVNSALSSTADVVTGFTDHNATITSKFSGKVTKIYGSVSIGLSIAEILANNKTAVASAKSALTLSNSTNLTDNITLTQTGSNVTSVTWATSDSSVITTTGAITRGETAGSATLTATITKGAGDTLATTTKTFDVTVAANPVSATNSTLATSSSTASFGGSAVTLTATAKNETNTSVSGKTVTFAGASLGTLSVASCTTVTDGTCTVTYTPAASGTDGSDTITASVASNGNSVTLGSQAISVVNNPYNISEAISLASDYNNNLLTMSVSGTVAGSTSVSLGTDVSPAPTGTVTDTTSLVTLYLVETSGDTTNFITFKYKTTAYATGKKIYVKVGTKSATIISGQTYTNNEVVLSSI